MSFFSPKQYSTLLFTTRVAIKRDIVSQRKSVCERQRDTEKIDNNSYQIISFTELNRNQLCLPSDEIKTSLLGFFKCS